MAYRYRRYRLSRQTTFPSCTWLERRTRIRNVGTFVLLSSMACRSAQRDRTCFPRRSSAEKSHRSTRACLFGWQSLRVICTRRNCRNRSYPQPLQSRGTRIREYVVKLGSNSSFQTTSKCPARLVPDAGNINSYRRTRLKGVGLCSRARPRSYYFYLQMPRHRQSSVWHRFGKQNQCQKRALKNLTRRPNGRNSLTAPR